MGESRRLLADVVQQLREGVRGKAMSTEARLKRLGLWHLHDKPEELSKELKRQIEQDEKKRAIEVEEMLKEKRKKYGNLPHLMRP